MKAAAGLALSGRYAAPAAQAAHGLSVWSAESGTPLTIEDTGTDPAAIERFYRTTASAVDLLFGPYGSGPLRAAERGLTGASAILWNHGGAAGDARRASRVVDVLGAATAYWSGLAAVLGERGIDRGRVIIARADSPFGRDTAAGARRSLGTAGAVPLSEITFDRTSAAAAVRAAGERHAECIIGCGRIEDDLALIEAANAAGIPVGAIVAGVSLAHEALGEAIIGVFGPAQWLAEGVTALGEGADYPAAQALGAGQIATAALERAGSSDSERLWDAVRSLRFESVLGPFAVDANGRQIAHAPLLVEWVATADAPRRRVIWRPS